MSENLPKVYWPGSQDGNDPTKPKILIPCYFDELEALLRIGWKMLEE